MSEPHQEQQNDQVVEEHEDSSNLAMVQSFVHNAHQEQDEDETEVIVASEIVQGNQHAQPSQPPLQKHISNVMTESTYEIQKKAENLLKQSSIPIPEASVVQETELEKSGKADNEFYPEDHQEVIDAPQPFFHPQTIDFYDSCGMDSNKKNNLWLINDQVFVYASAISYQFFNFKEGSGDIHFSRDGGGIGSIAVHPSKQWYSVAEKGNWPNVYIYSTNHKLYRILRRGTERSYSNSCFTKDGTKLATVGSSPDYQICIWDWKQENILLKAKAFSQEVYKVVFSEYNPNLLGTSGMGHIKFWKVAETFTGLKLKGEIGRQTNKEHKRQKYLKSMKDNVKKIKQHIQSGNAKLEALAKEIVAIEASNTEEYKSVKEEGIQFQTQYTQIIQDKLSLQDRLIFLKEQLRQKLTERDRLIDQDQEIENIIRSRDTEIYLKESALANKEDQLQKLKQYKDDLLNDTKVPEEEIQVQKPNSSLYDLTASDFLDKNIETKQIVLPQQQVEKQEKGCCLIF